MGGEGLCAAGGGAQVRAAVPALPKGGSPGEHRPQRGACLLLEPDSAPEPVSQDGPWWDGAGRVEPVKPVLPLQAW